MKTKPDLSFWKLWNLSFGFFGVQIAYALQSANVSRIFTTIGADPHDLSYFWILPPLMGLLVQPIVGVASDKTWNRFGRRLPYLILGALIAVAVMCLFPNAGSFHFAVSGAILFGLVALMLLDTSLNMAMQPFKMLVGDMVNEKQKGKAYSIQSFLCNSGQVLALCLPFILGWLGMRDTPKNEGEVPDTVIWSFYIGAIVLAFCVVYSMVKIKEWPPEVYNQYNNVQPKQAKKEKQSILTILKNAPSTFWTVGIVQFFCWFAFLYFWTYGNNTVAMVAFKAPATETIVGVKSGDITVPGKNIIISKDGKDYLAVEKGKAIVKGVLINQKLYEAPLVILNEKDTIVKNWSLVSDTITGIDKVNFATQYNAKSITVGESVFSNVDYSVQDNFYGLVGPATLKTSEIVKINNNNPHTFEVSSTDDYPIKNIQNCRYETATILNPKSKIFNEASTNFSLLMGVQALASVLWAALLPRFRNRKFSYTISLILGGGGFIMSAFVTNPWILIIPFALMGCAWAAMLAWPFTILTNSLKGGNIGVYLGLFNCTICIPQIVAAIVGGWILSGFAPTAEGLVPQYWMMVIGGISLVIGSLCVFFIKEGKEEPDDMKVTETPVLSDNI